MANKKLLLADDSITIQKVVTLTFANRGIDVIPVGDGDSALEIYWNEAPDLIMADVKMPGASGYEICEIVRARETDQRTPIILLVGSFEPYDDERAKNLGADGYLTKPFKSIKQLVNTVDLLLGNENSESSIDSDSARHEYFDEEAGTENSVAEIESGAIETVEAIENTVSDSFLMPGVIDHSELNESKSEGVGHDGGELKEAPEIEGFHLPVEPEIEGFSEEGAETNKKLEDEVNLLFDDRFIVAESSGTADMKADDLDSFGIDTESSGNDQTDTDAGELRFDQRTKDLIDAISRKVVENLADRAVKEIAKEIVPEMAEKIIRNMVEEKNQS